MKSLSVLGICLIMGTVSLVANSAMASSQTICRAQVQAAEHDFARVQDLFNVGEQTRTDLATAELNLLDIQFDCRAILFADYCAKAPALATQILTGIIDEARVGMRTQNDVLQARAKSFAIAGLCQ